MLDIVELFKKEFVYLRINESIKVIILQKSYTNRSFKANCGLVKLDFVVLNEKINLSF